MLDFDEPSNGDESPLLRKLSVAHSKTAYKNNSFSGIAESRQTADYKATKPVMTASKSMGKESAIEEITPTTEKHRVIFPMSASLAPVSIGARRPDADSVKIIGGQGYDVRQPVPLKYPNIRQHFLNARNNFWTPNDIAMGDDKMQWNTGKLTEEETWMFKCNISYLTASDNLVPDNLDNAILAQITANEMRQYLRWQMAEEANHIESYFFILESFGLDVEGQGQIFNLYQQVPELTAKLNWNLTFTNNVVSCGAPFGSPEANRALLEDLISYYIFEYLFFPLGFSQVFALARQGKLRNTAQQYQYIWRDENLHAINGRWLIRQIIKENPALWDKSMRERARAIINEAVILETNFGKATMPNGGIPGLSLKSYTDYARLMANNICQALGLELLFDIKEHPMAWLSEYEMKQEVNFFEGRVRDYRVGSDLKWE
ncbi:ribonucleotide-diphosphate reductase subunit beta [Beggiatoa leptomitoformis]|uniref:ribonucleoside-diphosphate reductase n=1 Tax=Beggiatoa leptomitoformis TaxID=288004 RepID=A0A2N9YIZ3_9GAMM|nr:ribonucleotide-diphosphate reductase subunit beta [Beggiatoa leptomitoformis]ALG67196.1 ribonucleotide-diphosphate reductase subunit beta [Beggiatoa leptomitoformis]AUI70477.2 ribonucleotide-diphosphate reductase subunit beta [Beggiatoa leptomitoformis]